jgi:oligopeptide transport system substrate-binding protein
MGVPSLRIPGRDSRQISGVPHPIGGQLMQKRLLGILASMAIIVTACGGATTTSAPPASTEPGASAEAPTAAPPDSNLADEQILRLYLGSEDPASLDPANASTSTDITVLHAIHRGLIYFDKDQNPVPALAESLPEVSADGLTYTFKLRDAKYSNGDPIVAGDLVYAWKRLIDPRTAALYQAIIQDVDGGQEIIDLTGVDPAPSDAELDAAMDKFGVAAPDDKTFVVTLDHPAGYFLNLAALWGTAPYQEKWITSPNATEAENYVSSGPFMLKSWTHQAELVIVPNPNWYGEVKPTLTEIRWHIGGDPAAAQAAFEAGETDQLKANPPDVPRIKADAELGPLVTTLPVLVFDYWGFDCTKGPTANVHFRRALAMAIDKETLLATAYGGQGVIAGSPVPPGMPGHQPDIGLPYDVDAAKAELATALTELGYSDVSEVPVLSFGFNTDAGHDIPAAYMQEQWSKNLGVKSELKGVTFDVFVNERPAHVYTLARNAWGADYPHPDNFLRVLFQSESGNNDEGYDNPEYDRLIAEAGSSLDFEASIALYNQAQEILVQDAPAVFTRWRVTNYEIRPWVTGHVPTSQDSNDIGDLFFETIKILKH